MRLVFLIAIVVCCLAQNAPSQNNTKGGGGQTPQMAALRFLALLRDTPCCRPDPQFADFVELALMDLQMATAYSSRIASLPTTARDRVLAEEVVSFAKRLPENSKYQFGYWFAFRDPSIRVIEAQVSTNSMTPGTTAFNVYVEVSYGSPGQSPIARNGRLVKKATISLRFQQRGQAYWYGSSSMFDSPYRVIDELTEYWTSLPIRIVGCNIYPGRYECITTGDVAPVSASLASGGKVFTVTPRQTNHRLAPGRFAGTWDAGGVGLRTVVIKTTAPDGTSDSVTGDFTVQGGLALATQGIMVRLPWLAVDAKSAGSARYSPLFGLAATQWHEYLGEYQALRTEKIQLNPPAQF